MPTMKLVSAFFFATACSAAFSQSTAASKPNPENYCRALTAQIDEDARWIAFYVARAIHFPDATDRLRAAAFAELYIHASEMNLTMLLNACPNTMIRPLALGAFKDAATKCANATLDKLSNAKQLCDIDSWRR